MGGYQSFLGDRIIRSEGWDAIQWAMVLRDRQCRRLRESVWADWRGGPMWRQRPWAQMSNSFPVGLYFGPIPPGIMRMMLAPDSMPLSKSVFSFSLMKGEMSTPCVLIASSQVHSYRFFSSSVYRLLTTAAAIAGCLSNWKLPKKSIS